MKISQQDISYLKLISRSYKYICFHYFWLCNTTFCTRFYCSHCSSSNYNNSALTLLCIINLLLILKSDTIQRVSQFRYILSLDWQKSSSSDVQINKSSLYYFLINFLNQFLRKIQSCRCFATEPSSLLQTVQQHSVSSSD